jgi:acetyl-CoA carboxylase biotin carboxylase subunit
MTGVAQHTLLVANRGEIARRIFRTAADMGWRSVAVHDPAEVNLPHVREADLAVPLDTANERSGYLDIAQLVAAARSSGATMVHPGYGFLSENAAFACAVQEAGLVWVGPSPEAIAAMGDKVRAKELMRRVGVPVLPGSRGPVSDAAQALAVAGGTGYPVMVKAAAGGGGMAMEIVRDADGIATAVERIQARAARLFGDPSFLVEQYIERSRHIEVQVLGLADGRMVALGERDCSVQRRHQKVAEECPSPYVRPELRRAMYAAAKTAATAISYRNAGTVEFIVDVDTESFYFLEMNTRLQVEHPVTEAVTGLDLVREQLLVALELPPSFDPDHVRLTGHAIELRVYAEDPVRFLPSPGLLTRWEEPVGPGVRVDAGYQAGNEVSSRYDPLLAKLVLHGASRESALERARSAVSEFHVEGPRTNLAFLARLLDDPAFVSGAYDTNIVAAMTAPVPATGGPPHEESP